MFKRFNPEEYYKKCGEILDNFRNDYINYTNHIQTIDYTLLVNDKNQKLIEEIILVAICEGEN